MNNTYCPCYVCHALVQPSKILPKTRGHGYRRNTRAHSCYAGNCYNRAGMFDLLSKLYGAISVYMSVHVVYLTIFIFDINTLPQEHDIGIEDAIKMCTCTMSTNTETFQKRRHTVGRSPPPPTLDLYSSLSP